MARKQPIPLSSREMVRACALAVFRPDAFEQYAKPLNQKLNQQPDMLEVRRIDPVLRGCREAAVWMIVAIAGGVIAGVLLKATLGTISNAVAALAVMGTGIILWATLAFQGWSIQTFADTTLEERVNRWLFRFLYSVGTALIAMAATWHIT